MIESQFSTITRTVDQFAQLLRRGGGHNAVRFAIVASDRLQDVSADVDLLGDEGLCLDELFTAELLIEHAAQAMLQTEWEFLSDASVIVGDLRQQISNLRQQLAH